MHGVIGLKRQRGGCIMNDEIKVKKNIKYIIELSEGEAIQILQDWRRMGEYSYAPNRRMTYAIFHDFADAAAEFYQKYNYFFNKLNMILS
jgi:hypothetical protein